LASGYYGSDRVLDVLEELGIPFIAMNPGATLRGLHDSLLARGDRGPRLISCLHEEVAVGIAHGYWKASKQPMAVGLHDTVGLLHGSMALFNAWVDQAALLALVGTGPLDALRRRPWIDWVHTVGEVGALVRPFSVWNDQPQSLEAAVRSLRTGWRAAVTEPCGPAVVALDVILQEDGADPSIGDRLDEADRLVAREGPDPRVVAQIIDLIQASRKPLIVTDRPLSSEASGRVVVLAEMIGAGLLDAGGGAGTPVGATNDVTPARWEAIGHADLLLMVDVRDPQWALDRVDLDHRRRTTAPGRPGAVLIGPRRPTAPWLVPAATGFSAFVLPGDISLSIDALLAAWGPDRRDMPLPWLDLATTPEPIRRHGGEGIDRAVLAMAVADAVRGYEPVLSNCTLVGNWARGAFRFSAAGQYLGRSGGEGLGYGLPASIGAALALRESGRLVVDIQADGDLLYVPEALWTAAHHQIPLLIVVDNNRRYLRDALHQDAVARTRRRARTPLEGIEIDRPAVDLSGLARAFGVGAIGPVTSEDNLREALRLAVEQVANGAPILVDVVTSGEPEAAA
jgi:thiamine pyrophosphate-dependent acetolactate synthase large subunit-like protein